MPYVPFDNALGIPNNLEIVTNLSNNSTMTINTYQETLKNSSFWKDVFCAKRDAIEEFCITIQIEVEYRYILFFAVLLFVMIGYKTIFKDIPTNPYIEKLNVVVNFLLPFTALAFLIYLYAVMR